MLKTEVESDNDGNFIIDQTELQYTHNVIEYIAGFVARKLKKKILCNECVLVIISSESIDQSSPTSLLCVKNKGGLIKPSEDVVNICKVAESTFKSNIGKISKQGNIIQYLIIKSSAHLKINSLFTAISNHILNQSPLSNHLLQIVNLILKIYLTIRLHHFNKTNSQPQIRIRSFLTKQIHFKNQ